MALQKPPQYVKTKWWQQEEYFEALAMSSCSSSSLLSQLLSQKTDVTNLFLTDGFELLTPGPDHYVLTESSSAGQKWGEKDLLVDMADVGVDVDTRSKMRLDILRAAANFGGTVYLMNVKLSIDEAAVWWDALRLSNSTPPKSLFFIFKFLANPTSSERSSAGQHLIHTLKHNKGIQNLAVYSSDLIFEDDAAMQPISLHTLHLENITVGGKFVTALAKRNTPCVNHTLTLSRLRSYRRVPRQKWKKCYANFLQWPLTSLSLLNFELSASHLIDFFKELECRQNHSLHSLSLGFAITISSCYHGIPWDTVSIADGFDPSSMIDVVVNDVVDTVVDAVVDALHASGLPFLCVEGLAEKPAIEAQLLQNQKKHSHTLRQPLSRVAAATTAHDQSPSSTFLKLQGGPSTQLHKKVPAVALRLFICGDEYAGKTTLLSSISHVCSHSSLVFRIKGYGKFYGGPPKRTRGIQVSAIKRENIYMSVWDMAGQAEFHAFHDHLFPDPSAGHGSPTMFMFVWSPITSDNESNGILKGIESFKASFSYWLKFIASKSRLSQVVRRLIVVITRKDQADLYVDLLAPAINEIATCFSNIIEVVKVLQVDARSFTSTKPVASCLFNTATEVLDGIQDFEICSEVRRYLSSKRAQKSLISKQPIIPGDVFSELIYCRFGESNQEIHKAIALSLNDSGDIIYMANMNILVLDPKWFCHEIIGALIHFPQNGPIIDGYYHKEYLEKLLEKSSHSRVKGPLLIALMEAMHLCCHVPNDPDARVFIPATLRHDPARRLRWRGRLKQKTCHEFAYVGRRLECAKKDLTFLTPGLFPKIQVLFGTAFSDIEADVKQGVGFMSVCVEDMELIVEFGLAKGQHVIDIMVRVPDEGDVRNTLTYVEEEIVKSLVRICAQPVGNQGVTLVEGIIRPDCLHEPAPSCAREDQCILIEELKKKLWSQLEEGRPIHKLLHLWKESPYVKAVADHFADLLGFEEYENLLISYKLCWENIAQEASIIPGFTRSAEPENTYQVEAVDDTNTHPIDAMLPGVRPIESETPYPTHQIEALPHSNHTKREETLSHLQEETTADENEEIVVTVSKSMAKNIYKQMQSMNTKLEGLESKMDSMHQDMHNRMNVLQKSTWNLRRDVLSSIHEEVKRLLHLGIECEVGKVPRFVFLTTNEAGVKQKLVKGLKSVQIELFCEHRELPHKVDGQQGLCVSMLEEGTFLKRALPYVNALLKLLTLVTKVGAHMVAGAGTMVPNWSELIAAGLDTPGLLDNKGLPVASATSDNFAECQQWLVSVLQKNGGMTESNIASKFLLRRALYEDTFQVAWLCDKHYKERQPFPLIC